MTPVDPRSAVPVIGGTGAVTTAHLRSLCQVSTRSVQSLRPHPHLTSSLNGSQR
jgi:hypothetical protein